MVGAERATASGVGAPAGYWQREASHYPKPLTPLGSSLFIEAARQSFPKVFAEFGLLAETLELREINGYVYTAIKPFHVGDRAGGQLPPKWLLWLVLRLHPAFRRRIADNKRAMRDRLDLKLLDRWDNEWRPSVIAEDCAPPCCRICRRSPTMRSRSMSKMYAGFCSTRRMCISP